MDATEPYPGVPSLLDWLKKSGYQTAIVSNKADFAVKKAESDLLWGNDSGGDR